MNRFAPVLLVAVMGCGPAHNPAPTSPEPEHRVDLDETIREVPECPLPADDASVSELQQWASTCIAHAQDAEDDLIEAIELGREIKDIVLIHCLDDRLTMISHYLDDMQEISEGLSDADELTTAVEQIAKHHAQIATVAQQAGSCLGESEVTVVPTE